MSVVFNSFKQRFLNGEVPKEDTWTFVPVNKEFTAHFNKNGGDYALEQFRNVNDFKGHDASGWNASFFQGIRTDYDWFKPRDTSGTNKPMFITSGVFNADGAQISASNWEDFQNTEFYKDVSANTAISSYLASGGFYFILKKDELRWFADRVNSGNNRIIGVFGDGIDGVIKGQIGKNEDYPFQGILDGNGHAIEDATFICDNDDNGLVGILGHDGVVKNFKITNHANELAMICEKQITLNHIKKDGRDIHAGMLVGRNYGHIENIDAHELNSFRFSGFVPQVYSVTNKSDDYEDFSTIRSKYDQGENFYYLNSYCINSPGNVCPYVGYFAEGLFAQSARGHLSNGSIASIELVPELKAKANPGLCDTTLNLESKCSLVAFYVKATGKNPGIFTGNNTSYTYGNRTIKMLEDPWYTQTADTEWGTNCVFLIAYDTKDELGKAVRYFIEMNGTAYDKKSGTGKRRYHFHAGHYNYKKHLGYLNTAAGDVEPDKNYYVQIGTYWIKKRASFDNGEDDSADSGIDESDFEIGDSDIKVYTADGVPAKLISKDIQVLYYSPRNFDTSSAVWETINWYAYMRAGTAKFLGIAFTEPETGKTYYVDVTYTVPTIHGIGNWNYHNVSKWTDSWKGTYVQNWAEVYTPSTIQVEGEANYYITDAVDTAGNKHATYRFYEVAEYDENGNPKYPETLNNGTKKWSSTSITNMTAAIQQALAEDLSSATSENVIWEYTSWEQEGPSHYSSRIIVDDQDKSEFDKYLRKRLDTWNNGHTYDGLHKYDIGINNEDGIRAKGSLVLSLLKIEDFQYRPFVHASETDGVNEAKLGLHPGARFGDMVDYGIATSANLLTYFTDKAKAYVQNPTYYGMDINGLWTTNVVRPDPENDPWRNRGTRRESYISTLNFNWNLMRQMFDTDNKYYQRMANYDSINDWEGCALDGYYDKDGNWHKRLDFSDDNYWQSDIPHSILNKPLKMNNMARAAYYISPIVGANFGRIQNVVVSAERTNEGNFVGFVGGLAGKQERGIVDHCAVYAKDKFKYWEGEPARPNFDNLDESAFSAAMAKYDDACKHYNYRVRYKNTPIMPNAVSEAVDALGDDPDNDWTQYEYYPAGSESRIDEDEYNECKTWTEKVNYLKSKGVKKYIRAKEGEEGNYFDLYTSNPDYIFDKGFFNASGPIRAFTSAWYDDYNVTANNVMDDVITYHLRPIFNAGGLFGKLVPTYNKSRIEMSANETSGTVLKNVNVHYILEDGKPESACKTPDDLMLYTKDIHDTFGAIAGMIELQTSQVSQSANAFNKIDCSEINVSAEGNRQQAITPFGFFTYQPNELPSMAATEGSPRQKGGVWGGEYTETTYALDYPIVINNNVAYSRHNLGYAPINQSSAAFFDFNASQYQKSNGRITPAGNAQYFKHILDNLIYVRNGVNINTTALTYCNPSALDIYLGYRGPECIASLFGSNTNFIPALPSAGNSTTDAREQLEILNKVRTYEVGQEPITPSNRMTMITNFSPINVDYLKDSEIFKKTAVQDIYFDYTYSSKSAFVTDWSFKHNVMFTSALDAFLAERGVKPNPNNIRMGYVFRDDMAHSGDGFWYKNNYLHLGNSVSPKHIRTELAAHDHLYTSGCAGYYFNPETEELEPAIQNHVYDGMLVLDSQDRTVMFIDNKQGARVEGGSFNLQCSSVYFSNSNGGMLLEVK